ncbi:MAG TPA: NUDIX hydrolase [Chloroflexota bacterium]|nr:NUDIX hydrolase [Chloroflexota bacterium]
MWTHPLLKDRVRTTLMWALNAKFAAGTTAIIRNERGEVLLMEHAFRRRYPWALPGGWMERQESPEAAVLREVQEETGLHVRIERLLTARTFALPRLDVVYVCRPLDPTAAVRGSSETPRWRWCAPGDYPPGVDPYTVELISLASADDFGPPA